jgi:hypothetical protein
MAEIKFNKTNTVNVIRQVMTLTLRVEHGMRVLRGIFTPKGEEASGC